MSFERPITNNSSDEADPDDRDALVDLPADRPSADALGDREDDVATVERKQRQEVEQGDRERDEAEHEQEVLGPLLGRVGRALHDPDRARDLIAPGPCHEPAERRRRCHASPAPESSNDSPAAWGGGSPSPASMKPSR